MTTIATQYPFVGNIESLKGGREENQDYAGWKDTPLGLLLVVCDGMGGGPGGRTASHLAVDTIIDTLADVASHTLRDEALRYAITQANDAIYGMASATPELMGMGTTVVAMIANERSAVVAHVGDSRLYLLRRGTIAYRTADHSYVGDLVRQGTITEEQARNHPQSNMITRALGIRPSVEIEINEISFKRGDRFVLCSDGIWGSLPEPELVASLSRVMGIDELTVRMAHEVDDIGAREGGMHDNLTLAVLDTTFSSELKHAHNDEKSMVVPQDMPTTESQNPKTRVRIRYLLMLIITCAVAAAIGVAVAMFQRESNDGQKDGTKEKSTGIKGDTRHPNGNSSSDNRTVDNSDRGVNDNNVDFDNPSTDNDDSYNATSDKLHLPNGDPSIGHDNSNSSNNIFRNAIQNNQREINNSVDQIVGELNNLKQIRWTNRTYGIMRVKGIVNGLKTNIITLGRTIGSDRKAFIEGILNDLKQVPSLDWQGRPTRQLIDNANKIINKLKELKTP